MENAYFRIKKKSRDLKKIDQTEKNTNTFRRESDAISRMLCFQSVEYYYSGNFIPNSPITSIYFIFLQFSYIRFLIQPVAVKTYVGLLLHPLELKAYLEVI